MRNPHLQHLSFNYLWSNPEAGDDVLASNALRHPRFDDLVILSKELGQNALHDAWKIIEKEGWPRRHTRAIAHWYLEIIDNAHRKLAEENRAAAAGARQR